MAMPIFLLFKSVVHAQDLPTFEVAKKKLLQKVEGDIDYSCLEFLNSSLDIQLHGNFLTQGSVNIDWDAHQEKATEQLQQLQNQNTESSVC